MPALEQLTLGSLDAWIRDIEVPLGLIIDSVHITGSRSVLQKDPFKIEMDDPADVEITLSSERIRTFLERLAPGGLKRFEVGLDDNRVRIDAVMTVLIPLPVSATCTLRIDAGKRLFVDLDSVNVLGTGPTSLIQKQLEAINPLIDLADLPIDAELQHVEVSNGRVLLTGLLRGV